MVCLYYKTKGVKTMFYNCEQSVYIREAYLKYHGLTNELEKHIETCKDCQEIHAQVIEELEYGERLFRD
jgi:hypothetical protein